MDRVKQLSHNQIRYIVLPFLALALVHFVSYGKLPYDEGYQFPLIPFFTVLLICVICCEANTRNYLRLSKKLSLTLAPVQTILKQITASLMLTTFIFAVMVYSLNYFVFGQVARFTQFLSSLFIALLIISVETLVYIVRDFKRAQIASKNGEANITWTINSGSKMLRIPLNEIAYLFSQNSLVYLVKTDGEKILTQFNSLNEVSASYNTDAFFRLNRQFMVSAVAVKEIHKDVNQKLRVMLSPAVTQIPTEATVSRYNSPEFKKWFRQ